MARCSLGLVHAGRLEEAQGLGELVYAVAVGNAELESRGCAALLVGLAALVQGEVRLAAERFTEAELLLEAGLAGVSRWVGRSVHPTTSAPVPPVCRGSPVATTTPSATWTSAGTP